MTQAEDRHLTHSATQAASDIFHPKAKQNKHKNSLDPNPSSVANSILFPFIGELLGSLYLPPSLPVFPSSLNPLQPHSGCPLSTEAVPVKVSHDFLVLIPGVMSVSTLLSSLAASDTASHSALRAPSLGFRPLMSLGSPPSSLAVPSQSLLQSALPFLTSEGWRVLELRPVCTFSLAEYQLVLGFEMPPPCCDSQISISSLDLSTESQTQASVASKQLQIYNGCVKLTSPKLGCSFFPSMTACTCTRLFLLPTANGDFAPQFLRPKAWNHPCFCSLLSHTAGKPSANTNRSLSKCIQIHFKMYPSDP